MILKDTVTLTGKAIYYWLTLARVSERVFKGLGFVGTACVSGRSITATFWRFCPTKIGETAEQASKNGQMRKKGYPTKIGKTVERNVGGSSEDGWIVTSAKFVVI